MTFDETQRRVRGHSFLPPKATRARIPKPYQTDGDDPRTVTAWVHYFTGGWDCYVLEMDPEPNEDGDYQIFTYARFAHMPECAEYGWQSLSALEQEHIPIVVTEGAISHRVSFVVERDLYWVPTSMGEILDEFTEQEGWVPTSVGEILDTFAEQEGRITTLDEGLAAREANNQRGAEPDRRSRMQDATEPVEGRSDGGSARLEPM